MNVNKSTRPREKFIATSIVDRHRGDDHRERPVCRGSTAARMLGGNRPSRGDRRGSCPTTSTQPFNAPKQEIAAPSAMTAAALFASERARRIGKGRRRPPERGGLHQAHHADRGHQVDRSPSALCRGWWLAARCVRVRGVAGRNRGRFQAEKAHSVSVAVAMMPRPMPRRSVVGAATKCDGSNASDAGDADRHQRQHLQRGRDDLDPAGAANTQSVDRRQQPDRTDGEQPPRAAACARSTGRTDRDSRRTRPRARRWRSRPKSSSPRRRESRPGRRTPARVYAYGPPLAGWNRASRAKTSADAERTAGGDDPAEQADAAVRRERRGQQEHARADHVAHDQRD